MGALQKPDATNVAGIRTWNTLGRFVKRGEKGILILAPMVGHRRSRQNEIATDIDTDNAADERKPAQKLVGFRAVYVFERLSRDLRPSPCALDVSASATLESFLDSSKHIIAQLLCPVQRILDAGVPAMGSFCPPIANAG